MNGGTEPSLKVCIHELLFWWKNEKCAPEILPPPLTAISRVKPLVQDITLRFADLQAEAKNKKKSLELSILEVEHRRVRYIYTDYLRVRLSKIESNPHYYSVYNSRLFTEETKYAKSLSQLLDSHFMTLHLSHIPPPFNKLPNLADPVYFECVLDKHVVIEPISGDVITVEITDIVEQHGGNPSSTGSSQYISSHGGEEIDDAFVLPNRFLTLEPGHRYMVRYKYIRELLISKMIRLV